MNKGKGLCIMCELLCFIIMFGHYVYEEDAWLNKTVCKCETVMETSKYDECEMHMLEHMMYDIQWQYG